MQLQFYSMQASPSPLTLEVRVMAFECCVDHGQVPVRQAMLSDDNSCFVFLLKYILDLL